jgi:hypothetical protein
MRSWLHADISTGPLVPSPDIEIKEVALIARLPPHHGESPSLMSSPTDSLFVSLHRPFFNMG